MEKNCRILNRIVEINIANVKYTDLELSGNTCFVGTNNFGKTSLQRAILFFYSANSKGLGISSSQKPFDEHYFRSENSYLIYEIATEDKPFTVIVYRHNKLVFRFIDAAYNPDFFFNKNDEAYRIKEIIENFTKANIYISNKIDTFERYRNILYGTETDKDLSKFYLLRGNEKYQNIPKSITNVFLSSKSSIDSRFIKDFIANSTSNEQSSIKLDQVERQLRQFNETYTDIETYLKKDTQQLIEFIDKKYSHVHVLRSSQVEIAEQLGNSLKYAEQQNEKNQKASIKKQEELDKLNEQFEDVKLKLDDQQLSNREEIGYYDKTIRDAQKKLNEYDSKNIKDSLTKHTEREKLQVELNIARREYESLTSNVQNIEVKFASLIEGLRNDKMAYINKINSQTNEIYNHYNELLLVQKDEFNTNETELKRKKDAVLLELNREDNSKQQEYSELKASEKIIKSERLFENEIKEKESELADLRAITYKNKSEKAIKTNMVSSIQKEWESLEAQLKMSLQHQTEKANAEIEKIKEGIKQIESKLNAQHHALYGFLESNIKDWHSSIGKVVHEDILFRTDLNPVFTNSKETSLYGVKLTLDHVEPTSKSLQEYQFVKNELLTKIKNIEETIKIFQSKNTDEKLLATDKFGKQIGELKEEVKVLTYALELAENKEKKINIELEDWKQQAQKNVELSLTSNRQKINIVEEELSIIEKKKKILLQAFNDEYDLLNKHHTERVNDIKARKDNEIAALEIEKKNQVKEYEEKENEIVGEKDKNFKSKGVDSKALSRTEQTIKELQSKLTQIDEHSTLVQEYLKDKRDIFDKLPDFTQKKESFIAKANQLTAEIDELIKKHNLSKVELMQAKQILDEEVHEFNLGMNYFNANFKETPVFAKYLDLIEQAKAKKNNHSIIELCTQLLKNDAYYIQEFQIFQRYINEFAGKFRLDNHFNFVIRNDATYQEYERFSQNLRLFVNESKIELSITETASQIGLVTDSVTAKVKELSSQKEKIEHIIELIAEDFKKAEFEESRLIEFIKIKIEDSENKVYKLLKQIQVFRDEHGLMYNEGLFSIESVGFKNRDLSTRAVKLLEQLRIAIKEQEQEEIRLQDLFELKFNIKEGMNETGWTHKIDSIGSTGTDILVKAIIYITLLHVFIKESSHRSSTNFKVHCIIDEVGQISAHYLRELLRFAKTRNIMMINGLPNKSGLEAHYKYTYQFRREEDNSVRIFPSIVTEVEA